MLQVGVGRYIKAWVYREGGVWRRYTHFFNMHTNPCFKKIINLIHNGPFYEMYNPALSTFLPYV